MKPHLRLRYGVWSCLTWVPRVVGCGATPAEAYAEWAAQLDGWPE